jgi:MFS family permease
MCMAGLYVVAESWLNDLATNKTRGRLLSVYMVVTMGGMTAGQFLLDAADPDGVKLFLLASVLVSASLVPVALSASSNPPLAVPEPMSLKELFDIVPTGIISSFWNGAATGILIGLGAVYAVSVDVPDSRIPVFLAAPLFGSMLLQWPIGYISDRLPRRGVMFAVAAIASGLCVALAFTASGSWLAIGLMTALGAAAFPIYSLTIAYTADWLPTTKLTAGSAALVRVNGVGALFGPLAATAVISFTSPTMYFWSMAAGNGSIAAYLAVRIVISDAPDAANKRRFVAFPARASAAAMGLMRGQRGRIGD